MSGLLGQVNALIKKAHEVEAQKPVDLPADIREWTGYKPHYYQSLVQESEKRFNVEAFHRRFGKTYYKINKLIEYAVECPYPMGRYAYVAPTYSMAEDIAWAYLMEFTAKFPNRKVEKAKLAIHLPTRSGTMARIRLYGVDSPKQRMRGLYLDGVVLDEAAWIGWSVWTEQIRPMLSDSQRSGCDRLGRRNQWADFIFTPYGRNHMYELYTKAQAWSEGKAVIIKDDNGLEQEVKQDDWYAAIMRASETGLIKSDELREIRITNGRSKYEQEFECNFDANVEGAIFGAEVNWLRKKGRFGPYEVLPNLPVHTAWDLGWDDATAIVFFQVVNPEDIRIVDYYENSFAPLAHYVDVLVDRGYTYGYHLFPHDVAVTDIGTGKSRESILRSLGVRVTPVDNVAKADGIAATQALLPYMRFDDTKAARLIDCLGTYRRKFNEALQTYGQEPVHDWASHGADAVRMLALGLRASGYDLKEAEQMYGKQQLGA